MSSAMWYKNGNFYDVPTTHVNFFLENPELLGFSQEEKERICVENGLSPDATFCPEQSDERVDILLEVMKRGAIRIRFYGGKTSVQCYDYNYGMNRRELQNCVMDGMGSVFGDIITVMDTKGWGEMLDDMGWGTQIKEFIAAALERRNRRRTIMDGRDRNEYSLNEIFNSNLINIYDLILSKKTHTKAREKFKNKLIGTDKDNIVLTWAIGTPENPMKAKSGDEENKEYRIKFEEMLHDGHFDFEKIHGQYGNEENSYFIPNITIEDAKNIFNKFGQESFIFGQKDYDDKSDQYYLEMEFWQREAPNQEFKLVDMEDKVEDKPDAIDYFSKSHGFKFNIPFSIFQASQRFFERYHWKSPIQLNSEAYVYITNANNHSGSKQWRYRGRMYHEPQSWELSDGLRNQYYHMWKDEISI